MGAACLRYRQEGDALSVESLKTIIKPQNLAVLNNVSSRIFFLVEMDLLLQPPPPSATHQVVSKECSMSVLKVVHALHMKRVIFKMLKKYTSSHMQAFVIVQVFVSPCPAPVLNSF